VDDLNPIVIGKVINPRTGLEEDDIVFRGFYITNSEVGKSSLKIAGGGTETTQPGERSCPAGYVVLDKPNQYGAFCEPKEGLPKTTPEACKFGMIGTPPDCHCPEHMEFAGYKGRVWVNQPKKGYCTTPPQLYPSILRPRWNSKAEAFTFSVVGPCRSLPLSVSGANQLRIAKGNFRCGIQ
jgi:hypothetical protein